MRMRDCLALFCLIVLFGCREKDSVPTVKISCQEFMDNSQFLMERFDVKFAYPSVNPNNTNQFSYVKKPNSWEHELFIHDLKTGTSNRIFMDVVFGQPVWSKDGNIYFINKDYAIIQVNPITKQAKTIVDNLGVISFLTASPSGSSLLFQRVEADSLKALIISTTGNIEKQFYYHTDPTAFPPYYRGYWYKGNNAIGITEGWSISTLDLVLEKSTKIIPFIGKQGVEITRVVGCEKCINFYILKYSEGLYRINMPAREAVLLKTSCILNEYESISLIDDTHAIVSKKVCTALNYSDLHCSSKIYSLNLYTGVEKEIILP